MYLILVPGQVVRFICLSNKNWKRDKSESEAWKIGAEISAVPYASVLRRVILLVFLAVAGELIWLMLVSLLIVQVQRSWDQHSRILWR